jgi:hypothetical protein
LTEYTIRIPIPGTGGMEMASTLLELTDLAMRTGGPGERDRLAVTRFWGGTDRGVCFQITLGQEFVSLTRAEALRVIQALAEQ